MNKLRKKNTSLVPDYTPLLDTLRFKNKNLSDLRNDLQISSATIAKIKKNDFVSLLTLAEICEYLNCNLNQVVIFKNEDV